MLKTNKNQKNNKITEFLLSLFVICFFSFIHGQVYIPQGVTVFVNKNTVVTENLANAISASGSASSKYSEKKSAIQQETGDGKTSISKKVSKKPVKKNTLELSKDRKQQAPKKEKSQTDYSALLFKNSSDQHFTSSRSSEKQMVFPDHHLEWEIPKPINTFYDIYFVEKNKSFYTSTHPLVRTSRSFRTRPPPSLVS